MVAQRCASWPRDRGQRLEGDGKPGLWHREYPHGYPRGVWHGSAAVSSGGVIAGASLRVWEAHCGTESTQEQEVRDRHGSRRRCLATA